MGPVSLQPFKTLFLESAAGEGTFMNDKSELYYLRRAMKTGVCIRAVDSANSIYYSTCDSLKYTC